MDNNELLKFIDEGEYNAFFAALKNVQGVASIEDEYIYSKKEGLDEMNFKKRLRTFVGKITKNLELGVADTKGVTPTPKYPSERMKKCHNPNALCVVVYSMSKSDFDSISNKKKWVVNGSRYGVSPMDWKPFANENTIKDLLEEYEKKGFPIVKESFGYDNEYINEFDSNKKYAVLIIDIHALFFLDKPMYKYDNINDIGSLVFPICSTYSSDIKNILVEKRNTVFNSIKYAYYENLDTPYTHVELDVSTKYDFFRRLTNIAVSRFGLGKKKMIQHIPDKQISGISDTFPNDISFDRL